MKVHEYREMMRYLTRKPVDKEIAQAVDVKERVRETTPFYQKPKELVQDDKPAPPVDSINLYQGVPSDVAIEEKMPVYFPPDMIRSMPVAPDLPYPPVQVELAEGGRVDLAKGSLPDYNALSNEARSLVAKNRMLDFVKNFQKENNRLPSQQEIRKLGNFDFATVKKAIESGDIKVLPLESTKGQFTKIPVEKDLKKLDQSKVIKDAFKSGEVDLKDVQKVLKTDDITKAANRITQLANVYVGEQEIEGIKPKFKKTAQEILDTNPFEYRIREIYEKSVAKSVGEKRTPSSIRTTTQRDVIPNVKGYSIDEPAGVTSSIRNRTSPYAVFSQIIDTDINKTDKYAFDSVKSKKEKVLQNAIESGDKKLIDKAVKDFNRVVSYYEEKINKDIKPGEKRIRLFQVSLDAPENTIKNFDKMPSQYQEAFKNNFDERGYSYKVPKDIKTIYQIGEELKDPKVAANISKKAAAGQARIYSEFLPGTQVMTSSLGDYLKGISTEVKAGKIVSPFLKVLGPLGTAVGAYDVAESYIEGKPLPETIGSFIGIDPLIENIREEYRLTPEVRKIKEKIRVEDLSAREYTPGLDVLPPDIGKPVTDIEKQKVAAAQEEVKKQIEGERLATKEDRATILDYLKNRFSPFTKEDDLYIPPLNKPDTTIREGVLSLATGGKVKVLKKTKKDLIND